MASEASVPLLKGTVDLLVPKTVSWEAMHGYAIASWLEHQSAGELWVEDSALYQALHRLEARQLVEAEWGVTETNPACALLPPYLDGTSSSEA